MQDSLVLRPPGRGQGLVDVLQHRYLLRLLVNKEVRVRYRGSVLGMLWSYAKPAIQFLVFYMAVGVFLRMNDSIDNYVIYLFSGIVVINYFNEILGNTTRSVVGNSALVKKIYLPRELFPVSSAWVAFVHLIPQLVILIIGAFVFGWRPTVLHLLAIIVAIIIITVFTLGLGLIAGSINVFFRDAENFVELIQMVVTWTSPVLYMWTMVRDAVGDGALFVLFQLNPITAVVEIFHWGFWGPTNGVNAEMPPNFRLFLVISALISAVVLVIGELVFRRLDGKFAQEL